MRKFFLKPMADFGMALLLFICFIPLFILIGLLIKVDSKGPVFFLQTRVGKGGKLFQICKFRSMVVNAENIGAKQKVSMDDQRITRVGKFLRKFSLDELPQVINVLKGEMSFVGPRPTLPYQVEAYSKYQMQRLQVKPGITGLAQVRGRNSLNWNQRIRIDVLYVKNYSYWLDIWIIKQTVAAVMFSKDIYSK